MSKVLYPLHWNRRHPLFTIEDFDDDGIPFLLSLEGTVHLLVVDRHIWKNWQLSVVRERVHRNL